jgi:hypothetical protein
VSTEETGESAYLVTERSGNGLLPVPGRFSEVDALGWNRVLVLCFVDGIGAR